LSRNIANSIQSPHVKAKEAGAAHKTQLNQVTGGNKNRRALNSDDTVVFEIMKARPGEEAHHRAILKTLDPLYKGLTDEEAAELTAYLNQFNATGNDILNLINLPSDIHAKGAGGIHAYAQQQGYEYAPNREPKGLVLDIIEASEMPLAYRKHVGMNYMTKAVPAMNNYINDLLTAHPSMKETLDMSSVRAAQAAEAQAQLMLNAQVKKI